MDLKITLTILVGFACTVMMTVAYYAGAFSEGVALYEQSIVVGNDAKGVYHAVSNGKGATTEKPTSASL